VLVVNTTTSKIRKVVVLGAGTMGAQAAAHVLAQGLDVVLLDIASPAPDRNAAVKRGVEMLKKLKPSPLQLPEQLNFLTTGNFEDDWDQLRDADWVFEAVVENLAIKQKVWGRVVEVAPKHAILSSNTSGLGIGAMSAQLPEERQRNFLGTHFFNPPRYQKLLETIPGPKTDPGVLEAMEAFCEQVLGKGVVRCKDTPDFIGNRIGCYAVALAFHTMEDLGLTQEEVDALTGEAIGRPKSATYRTCDVVGLDIVATVCGTVREHCPKDPELHIFQMPKFVQTMVEKKILGDKTGGGFYKREGKEIRSLDFKTFEYRPRQEPNIPALKQARGTLANRVTALLATGDKYAEFLTRVLYKTVLYAAALIPEVSDDVVSVDRALEWGYGWSDGPFRLLDALGPKNVAQWARSKDLSVPAFLQQLLDSGREHVYETQQGVQTAYLTLKGVAPVPERPGVLNLAAVKAQRVPFRTNPGASIVDIGDGVALLEFHSKMNALGEDIFSMLEIVNAEVPAHFDALVIGNTGKAFSAGADISLILQLAKDGKWDHAHQVVRRFQKLMMDLKYGPVPVVAAPFGLTLGGGCEVALHANRMRASAETYMGLVEVGVGVVPAGGGMKELALRAYDRVAGVQGAEPLPFLQRAFETIAMAKTSTSGAEAQRMFFGPADSLSANPDRILEDAKQIALNMVKLGGRPRRPRSDIPVAGRPGIASLKVIVHNMRRGNFISDHDVRLATHVATVLCGGDRVPGVASEQHFLDLEREAFVSLLGTKESQDRMQHMLTTGKPLRN
jgi:3-hydroxyacyl-CoA dehydrogenase